MPHLQTVSADGVHLHLEWSKDDQIIPEQVTMKSEFAAREAAGLLMALNPTFRSEGLVRKVLKTVPKGPR